MGSSGERIHVHGITLFLGIAGCEMTIRVGILTETYVEAWFSMFEIEQPEGC